VPAVRLVFQCLKWSSDSVRASLLVVLPNSVVFFFLVLCLLSFFLVFGLTVLSVLFFFLLMWFTRHQGPGYELSLRVTFFPFSIFLFWDWAFKDLSFVGFDSIVLRWFGRCVDV